MKVRLTVPISGLRNGARWPDVGETVDLPRDEAEALVDNAMAEPVEESDEPERPPEGGPGSGRKAWAAYARAVDVEVDDDMSRDDIVDAVDEAAAG